MPSQGQPVEIGHLIYLTVIPHRMEGNEGKEIKSRLGLPNQQRYTWAGSCLVIYLVGNDTAHGSNLYIIQQSPFLLRYRNEREQEARTGWE